MTDSVICPHHIQVYTAWSQAVQTTKSKRLDKFPPNSVEGCLEAQHITVWRRLNSRRQVYTKVSRRMAASHRSSLASSAGAGSSSAVAAADAVRSCCVAPATSCVSRRPTRAVYRCTPSRTCGTRGSPAADNSRHSNPVNDVTPPGIGRFFYAVPMSVINGRFLRKPGLAGSHESLDILELYKSD